MLDQFSDFALKNRLWTTEDRLLVAVSGGVDSMVLVHLLRSSNQRFALAHVNYGLRGAQSDADEALIKTEAKKWDLTLHVFHASIDKEKENVQEQARSIRYGYFSELSERHNYTKVLTAHHLDDRIETTLMNLMRGTGIYGMKGIPLQRGQIVRPMRWASKKLIESYADQHKIAFRHDQSNESADYTRNRVRNALLPVWQSISPQFHERLAISMKHLEADGEALAYLASSRLKQLGDAVELALLGTEEQTEATVIYHAFRSAGVNRAEALEMAYAQVGARWEKAGVQFIKSSKHISQIPKNSAKDPALEWDLKAQVRCKAGKFQCKEINGKQPQFDKNNLNASLHLSSKELPLTIRALDKDDLFQPLGMQYKVNARKYLLEKGASYAEIHAAVVLCTTDHRICWIPGWQISEEFKLQPEHSSYLSLSFVPNGD